MTDEELAKHMAAATSLHMDRGIPGHVAVIETLKAAMPAIVGTGRDAWVRASLMRVALGPDTLTEERTAGAPPVPTEEKKETPDDIECRARKPPKDGPCKRCGNDRPLNRLFLCYPCWVKTRLEERGWREGQPHPADCGCEADCRFESAGAGN